MQPTDSAGVGARIVRYLGVALIWGYRLTLKPFLGAGSCKYHPSCSEYAVQSIRTYGVLRGLVLAAWRLLRCNPWSHGGYDPVEAQTIFHTRTPTS